MLSSITTRKSSWLTIYDYIFHFKYEKLKNAETKTPVYIVIHLFYLR